MNELTIIMTSCDRWDLFTQTLDSFFKLNTYPYVAFHVHNDSVKAIPKEIKERYKDKNITWHEGTKRGLSAAWDYLVALVETEYFFNLEDDWLFYEGGNIRFIEQSFRLIDYCDQVWIRSELDHMHGLSKRQFLLNAVNYRDVLKTKDWCGFTFNPSLRKKSKWLSWFPKGISGIDEIDLSRELMDEYLAFSLKDGACRHIGGGRHTIDFKI